MTQRQFEHIICLIENVGLNATRHQNQKKVMADVDLLRIELLKFIKIEQDEKSNKNKNRK